MDPEFDDEEVIDSEGEEDLLVASKTRQANGPADGNVSRISEVARTSRTTSSIDDVSSSTSLQRNKTLQDSISTGFSSNGVSKPLKNTVRTEFSIRDFSEPPSRIQISKKTSAHDDSVIELSSDNDDDLSIMPPPKPKSTSSSNPDSVPRVLSSSSSRPRPRPVKKARDPVNSDNAAAVARAQAIMGRVPSDALPTSSRTAGRYPCSSSLPPSDPPLPSSHSSGVPPIAILPQRASSSGMPSSSGHSAPSRRADSRMQFLDELVDDDAPPGTFFALSTPGDPEPISAPAPPRRVEVVIPKKRKQKQPKAQQDPSVSSDPKTEYKAKKKIKKDKTNSEANNSTSGHSSRNRSRQKDPQDFKSAEIIDDSDDELSLQPAPKHAVPVPAAAKAAAPRSPLFSEEEKDPPVSPLQRPRANSKHDVLPDLTPSPQPQRYGTKSKQNKKRKSDAKAAEVEDNEDVQPKCKKSKKGKDKESVSSVREDSTKEASRDSGTKKSADENLLSSVSSNARPARPIKAKRQGKRVIDSEEDDDEIEIEKESGHGQTDPATKKTKAIPQGPLFLPSTAPVPGPDVDQSMDVDQDEKSSSPAKASFSTPMLFIYPDPQQENRSPEASRNGKGKTQPGLSTPAPFSTPSSDSKPSLYSRYSIGPRRKSTPMSELIQRANSRPNSPFSNPSSSSALRVPGTAYSPYLKSSRSLLSKIAPLHPNRRTPPPPPPPPPPKKKTKKQLELEEKWEEELIESVGGTTEWACMSDYQRKEMRKAKWDREMGGWED